MPGRGEKIQRIRSGRALFSWFDLIIYAVIVAMLVWMIVLLTRPSGDTVEVCYTDRAGGAKVFTRPLAQDGEFSLPDIDFEFIMVIEGGEVYVKASSCDNKICIYHGRISRVHDVITCSPNNVMITVVNDDEIADNSV